MTTIKEEGADICPHCQKPMVVKKTTHGLNEDGVGYILYAYVCETDASKANDKKTPCEWYGTGRAIQTDLRGNLMTRDMGQRGMDKDYTKMTPDALFRGKIALEEIIGQRIEDDNNIPTKMPVAPPRDVEPS